MCKAASRKPAISHRKSIAKLHLIDRTFFHQVFQNNVHGIELLLRTILDRTSLSIVSVQTQHFNQNHYEGGNGV